MSRAGARDAEDGCHLGAAAPKPREIPLRAARCPLASHCNYTWARYLHAQLGRFCSRDPVNYLTGSTDLYSYVDNLPTSQVDPEGLMACRLLVFAGHDFEAAQWVEATLPSCGDGCYMGTVACRSQGINDGLPEGKKIPGVGGNVGILTFENLYSPVA